MPTSKPQAPYIHQYLPLLPTHSTGPLPRGHLGAGLAKAAQASPLGISYYLHRHTHHAHGGALGAMPGLGAQVLDDDMALEGAAIGAKEIHHDLLRGKVRVRVRV